MRYPGKSVVLDYLSFTETDLYRKLFAQLTPEVARLVSAHGVGVGVNSDGSYAESSLLWDIPKKEVDRLSVEFKTSRHILLAIGHQFAIYLRKAGAEC